MWNGYRSGEYTLRFERESASLEQIEKINWAQPMVQYTGPHGAEYGRKYGLPAGYGFEIVKITYEHSCKTYCVTIKAAQQYLGDVTQHQVEIDNLRALKEMQEDTISKLTAALAEVDELVISLYEAKEAADQVVEQVETEGAV